MTDSTLGGQKVLVLGMGDSGLSMARYLVRRGARLRVADSREMPPHLARLRAEVPEAETVSGAFHDEDFAWADLVAISPGVPLATPEVRRAQARGIEVVGDVELFARALDDAHRSARLIAVTGSNGKSTVTTMAGEICVESGTATMVAGNIGVPVLDALVDAEERGALPEAWVLELSSFQLETTASLRPTAATVLNLSADHLDRYPGMAEYAAAKARIFMNGGIQVLNRDDPAVMRMAEPGGAVSTFGLDAPASDRDFGIVARPDGNWLARGSEALMAVADLPVAGLHNSANALAALALTRAVGIPMAAGVTALFGYRGLPHRVEFVAEVCGVRYYDDSKGTNVGATEAALRGFDRPVVVILGGEGKGQDFAPLRHAVAERSRAVVLIGRDAPLIRAALEHAGVPLHAAITLDEAVRLAAQAARPGDAVLLSPACASFDMFRDYAHRAQVFVEAVHRLVEAARA